MKFQKRAIRAPFFPKRQKCQFRAIFRQNGALARHLATLLRDSYKDRSRIAMQAIPILAAIAILPGVYFAARACV